MNINPGKKLWIGLTKCISYCDIFFRLLCGVEIDARKYIRFIDHETFYGFLHMVSMAFHDFYNFHDTT